MRERIREVYEVENEEARKRVFGILGIISLVVGIPGGAYWVVSKNRDIFTFGAAQPTHSEPDTTAR